MKTNVKFLLWSLSIFIVIAGCSSSSDKNKKESYSHLISLEKPGEEPSQPSKVYIDSVKKITENKRDALLISGTLPDACTKLEEVTHHTKNDTLYLEVTAWRNPEEMCAQVLTPFTYIYDQLSEKELKSHSELVINGTAFSIK